MDKKPIKKDDWGIVLDYLAQGLSSMARSEPIAQLVGDQFFSLLEVIVREDTTVSTGERVYIGDGKRDKVKYIRGRVEYGALTASAKQELELIVTEIVKKNVAPYLEFFNKAGSLSTRMHQLELLPGIGKKHLWALLDARKERLFESFEDIKSRVPLMPEPEKVVVRRVLAELQDEDKYRIFVPRMEAEKERRW